MSCLFESFTSFISNISHEELRHIICEYLLQNPVMYDSMKASDSIWDDNNSLKSYVDNMRLTSTWGSALEIKAFCNIFNASVVLKYNGKFIDFHPISGNSKFTIVLGYTGDHYYPINVTKND